MCKGIICGGRLYQEYTQHVDIYNIVLLTLSAQFDTLNGLYTCTEKKQVLFTQYYELFYIYLYYISYSSL